MKRLKGKELRNTRKLLARKAIREIKAGKMQSIQRSYLTGIDLSGIDDVEISLAKYVQQRSVKVCAVGALYTAHGMLTEQSAWDAGKEESYHGALYHVWTDNQLELMVETFDETLRGVTPDKSLVHEIAVRWPDPHDRLLAMMESIARHGEFSRRLMIDDAAPKKPAPRKVRTPALKAPPVMATVRVVDVAQQSKPSAQTLTA